MYCGESSILFLHTDVLGPIMEAKDLEREQTDWIPVEQLSSPECRETAASMPPNLSESSRYGLGLERHFARLCSLLSLTSSQSSFPAMNFTPS